ncbi:hypothetical protein PsYK624_128640 [Phanerochaete sordida]|uniref:F-box domain-containing protein n=1 Tax=Phanerochaete sordida TaxID=48140 RepID=A0A9P3GIR5_9APHY|nr:hypothetical protein PsYK624_128640 [Phanerochaete sordida]
MRPTRHMSSLSSGLWSARRVPPELFKRIMASLVADVYAVESSRKRQIGQCALVCRYWAECCRPTIFSRLSLQCAFDVHRFLEFSAVTTLGYNISDFVEIIYLNLTLPTSPWIHLFLHTAPHAIFSSRGLRKWEPVPNIRVQVSPSIPDGTPIVKQHAPRSLFHGLPRTPPVSIKSDFPSTAHVSNLHFSAPADLLSFVASWGSWLPSTLLILQNVTWEIKEEAQPPEAPQWQVGRRSPTLHIPCLDANNCTAVWPLIWLHISTRRLPAHVALRGPVYLRSESAHHTAALVKLLFDDCHCYLCTSGTDRDFSLREAPYQLDPHWRRLVVSRRTGFHELVAETPMGTGTITTIRLSLLHWYSAVRMRNGPPPAPTAFNFDWPAFDQQANDFDASPIMQIILPNMIFQEYEPFIRTHMPATNNTGRLKIVTEKDRQTEELLAVKFN